MMIITGNQSGDEFVVHISSQFLCSCSVQMTTGVTVATLWTASGSN